MSEFPSRPSLFSRTLRECRNLYVSGGERIVRDHAELISGDRQDYVQLMDDLHRGLVLKVYVTVCEADQKWSKQERFLAEVLHHHLWGQWLSGEQLRSVMKQASGKVANIEWDAVFHPFVQMPPLREQLSRLETLVSRMGNLVARCDGELTGHERQALKAIEEELVQQADRAPGGAGRNADDAIDDFDAAFDSAFEQDFDDLWSSPSTPRAKEEQPAPKASGGPRRKRGGAEDAAEEPAVTVEQALAELDELIGLADIKREVRSLANFLKLQQRRDEAGLPQTDISLHMVFTGNPGTGKTTVARIVGKVFKALGVLEKGHLIETDRSGLVAEYAGQTGPKTNKRVDDALDGMLFVDEAYSLVASGSDDPYGREATQALLKRAEDDRARLVVILAGYPDEMQQLLLSNPGLSSRFNRRMEFVDYTPLELARIFGLMCKKNHYELAAAARLKILLGFEWLYARRDRHFGNGRAARNLFEHAVRRMANRLADDADITQDELVTLEAADIEFEKVPGDVFAALDEGAVEVHLECPECGHSKDVPTKFLGQKVKCPKCNRQFFADWGELIPKATTETPGEAT